MIFLITDAAARAARTLPPRVRARACVNTIHHDAFDKINIVRSNIYIEQTYRTRALTHARTSALALTERILFI